jgi:uncharacterized protein (TIGR03086 family)
VIPPGGERELLDGAVSYALAGAALATPPRLSRPTPCAGWDLGTLLDHLSDSVGVLADVIGGAGAAAATAAPDLGPAGDPVARLRGQVARLRAAGVTAAAPGRLVAIGDRAITTDVVAVTGAIEITVHGWDIFAACDANRPVPPGLAAALLPSAAVLVTPSTRRGLFADPVRLPGPACPGDQLVALLGRRPCSPAAWQWLLGFQFPQVGAGELDEF